MDEEYISRKLETLEKTRGYLHQSLDKLVDETVKTGKAWIEKQDEYTLTAKETSQLIDNVFFYLNGKNKEFTNIKEKIRDGNVEGTSEEEKSSQNFQTTLQSFSHNTGGGSAESEVRMTHQLLARFGVLEEAVCSLKGNVEEIAQEQTSMRTECQEMISTHSQKLTQADARLDHLEERAYDINNNVEELEKNEKEHVKTLESMNQEIKVAKKTIDDLAKKTGSLETAMEKVKLECDNTSQTVIKLDGRLMTVEEHGQPEMEKVKTHIEELKTDFGEQKTDFKELKTNHSVLCQMMDNKLKPLIQLRHILNAKVKEKNTQLQELKGIPKELSDMKSEIQTLGKQCARQPVVGFTASVIDFYVSTVGGIICPYEDVTCNHGQEFCKDTGIFTAPVKGTYVACLRVWHFNGDGQTKLKLFKTTKNHGIEILSGVTANPDSRDFTIVVTDMEAEATFSVHAFNIGGKAALSIGTKFSCFLIG